MLTFYNTQTRKKQEFVPVYPGEVRMYACGPTVYNYFHVGNARPFVLFDTLRRYLEYKGYKVTFVQNFTDIDDKMIQRANEEGITVKELGDRFIAEYQKDAEALGIRPATVHPRATEHIPQIIALVQRLIDRGLAYEAHGDVYFNTQADPDYGKLSGQTLESLDAGARVGIDEEKSHPMDFALWKAEKPGEPSWPSPWGMGRPGWHVECSAMSMEYLGDTLDIHTGAIDLIFPHHENEIAQSEGATGHVFVRNWLHCGYINIDNQKMSKSAGNFFTVRDIAAEYDLESVRMFLLSAHYRSPVNFSRQMIEQAQAALLRLYNARDGWQFLLRNAKKRERDGTDVTTAAESAPTGAEIVARFEALAADFEASMDDDFNTAEAMGSLFEMVTYGNQNFNETTPVDVLETCLAIFLRYTDLLGLLVEKDEITAEAKAMAKDREAARARKDWAESDRLRDALREMGYAVEDTRQGQRVTKL